MTIQSRAEDSTLKLGPHVNDFGRLDLKTLIGMRPPILKTLQASPKVCAYKQEVGGLVIARSYVPTLDSQIVSKPAAFLAGRMRDALMSEWRALLYHIDYFELVNETAQTGDALKHLTDFTCEALRLMHAEGHKVAVGSFSVGNPNLDEDWRTFEPAVRAADAVALHEYGAPKLWSQPGLTDPPNAFYPKAGNLGWWGLRYRRARQIMVDTYGCGALPPFIITECGIDLGAIGKGSKGWRSSGSSAAEYVQQLAWYNKELSLDDYVLGATVFCYGGTPDWEDYDLAGVSEFETFVRSGRS